MIRWVDKIGREMFVVDIGLSGVDEIVDRIFDRLRAVDEWAVWVHWGRSGDVLEFGRGLGFFSNHSHRLVSCCSSQHSAKNDELTEERKRFVTFFQRRESCP